MSDIIIRAESLSKLDKIGALKQRHESLRDQLDPFEVLHTKWQYHLFTMVKHRS